MFQQDFSVQFLTVLGPFRRQANKVTDQHGMCVSDSDGLGSNPPNELMGKEKHICSCRCPLGEKNLSRFVSKLPLNYKIFLDLKRINWESKSHVSVTGLKQILDSKYRFIENNPWLNFF